MQLSVAALQLYGLQFTLPRSLHAPLPSQVLGRVRVVPAQ
jgi:hypothetical protein